MNPTPAREGLPELPRPHSYMDAFCGGVVLGLPTRKEQIPVYTAAQTLAFREEGIAAYIASQPTTPPPPSDAAQGDGIEGELVEIGDDEEGQPRIVIHTTREAIKAHGGNLLFRRVTVAAHKGEGN